MFDKEDGTHNRVSANELRSFIALELSGEARDEISRVENILKETEDQIKWVNPRSVHLTLKFLGNIPEHQISSITEHLEGIASHIRPFDIVLGGIGAFPGWGSARVLWIGLDEGSEQVKDLAGEVETAMAMEGFEKDDRPFRAHLTIGRVKKLKNGRKLGDIAASITVEPVRIRVSRLILFKSILGPRGAEYNHISVSDLSG